MNLVILSTTFLFCYAIYCVYLYPRYFSPLRHILCPPAPPAIFSGHIWHQNNKRLGGWELDIIEKLENPTVFRYLGFLGSERLVITDPVALTHILVRNPYIFSKTRAVLNTLASVLGHGLVTVEGEDHRRQRRIMAPSFGPANINELLPIFYEHSINLKTRWSELLIDSGQNTSTLNALSWLNLLTLDSIGKAGFGYEFNAVSGNECSLNRALRHFIESSPKDSKYIFSIALMSYFPFIFKLPTRATRKRAELHEIISNETNSIVQQRMNQVKESSGDRKDMLSRILASMPEGKTSNSASMSRYEISSQITTFLLAGHETTSVSAAWLLYRLAIDKKVQAKLRDELLRAGMYPLANEADDNGSQQGQLLEVKVLESLPYLDAVIKESLRLDTPVERTIRNATEDSIVPLQSPVRLSNGQLCETLYIPKGTLITLPMSVINRSKQIWGDDAELFKPERWMDMQNDETRKSSLEKGTNGFTTFSHILTFLGGSHGCIGYRFAVLELKAIISVLISNFDFDVPFDNFEDKIFHRTGFISRPYIRGQTDLGPQMPLKIHRITERD